MARREDGYVAASLLFSVPPCQHTRQNDTCPIWANRRSKSAHKPKRDGEGELRGDWPPRVPWTDPDGPTMTVWACWAMVMLRFWTSVTLAGVRTVSARNWIWFSSG